MKKERKTAKRGLIKTILLVVGGILVVLLIAAFILGKQLLNRISRPDVATVFEDDIEEVLIPEPTLTPPTPTPSVALAVTSTPEPTPEPTPEETVLPMDELYTQTRLDAQTLERMAGNIERTADSINILLIGVDRRAQTGNANADTVMIATIDRKNSRLKLTSLMRDMVVDIPGHGYDKLNSAASKGGIALLLETINANFKLNITQYVMVDFTMFTKVVNAIGGVTISMTAQEISAANDCIAGLNKQLGVSNLWDGFIFANPGNVKLSGKQALGYARIRKIDSDYARTNRQFKVLMAAFANFMNLSLTKQYALLYDILPLVETNLSDAEILFDLSVALGTKANGLLSFRVPADDMHESGHYNRKSVLLADVPANAQVLHEFIFDSTAEPEEATVLKPGASLPVRTPPPPTPSPNVNRPPNWPWGLPIYPSTPQPQIPVIPEVPIPEIPEEEPPEEE